MTNEHPCACVTLTVRPATLSVPLRAASVEAATFTVRLPFPLPDDGPATVSQGTALDACQPQPGAVAIVTVNGPPAPEAECVSGDTS